MIFAGDFRQTLPVVPKGQRATIVNKVIIKCAFWKHVVEQNLSINERVRRNGNSPEHQAFADWLLNVGNGTIPPEGSISSFSIPIPLMNMYWNPRVSAI